MGCCLFTLSDLWFCCFSCPKLSVHPGVAKGSYLVPPSLSRCKCFTTLTSSLGFQQDQELRTENTLFWGNKQREQGQCMPTHIYKFFFICLLQALLIPKDALVRLWKWFPLHRIKESLGWMERIEPSLSPGLNKQTFYDKWSARPQGTDELSRLHFWTTLAVCKFSWNLSPHNFLPLLPVLSSRPNLGRYQPLIALMY